MGKKRRNKPGAHTSSVHTTHAASHKPVSQKKSKVWYVVAAVVLIIVVALVMRDKPTYDDPNLPKPVYGNVESPVLLEEFGDLQCPACGQAHVTVQQIKEEYGDRIQYKFYHFPLSFHHFAQKAAEAAECAKDQGMFFEYIDVAYTNQNALQQRKLKEYASQLGLDQELFDACLDSDAKELVVKRDIAEGNKYNVRGTPTFFINGVLVDNWNYLTLKSRLDAELAKVEQ